MKATDFVSRILQASIATWALTATVSLLAPSAAAAQDELPPGLPQGPPPAPDLTGRYSPLTCAPNGANCPFVVADLKLTAVGQKMWDGYEEVIGTKLDLALVCTAVLLPAAGFSHHAQAPFFDQSREVEIEGVVTRFDFRNPHPVLYVDVTNDAGEVESWEIQFGNATGLRRRGWHRDIIQPGERVTARGHPSWNPGTRGMQGARVLKEDGSILGAPVED